MSAAPIKILIVDDSPVSRDLLAYIIEKDPQLKIIGFASDGDEALEYIKKENPDVVTMDIVMPKMDGFDVTRRIIQERPTPIIIVSNFYNRQNVDKCFKAIDAGALAILEKPRGLGDREHEEMAKTLIETIKLTSNAKLLLKRIIPKSPASSIQSHSSTEDHSNVTSSTQVVVKMKAIAIGAEIGGPQALHTILSQLPKDFPVPIFIVQHISSLLLPGLIDWLSNATQLKVSLAKDGEKALPGNVYLAPNQAYLEVSENDQIRLSTRPKEEKQCVSIDRLFQSIAKTYGANSIDILLTGKGTDGVKGLMQLKTAGACTIAQQKDTCLQPEMVEAAVSAGAVIHCISIDQLANYLNDIIKKEYS